MSEEFNFEGIVTEPNATSVQSVRPKSHVVKKVPDLVAEAEQYGGAKPIRHSIIIEIVEK